MTFRSIDSWEPHTGQREFLESGAKIRVLACGRRWGKTDACAAFIVNSILGGMGTYDIRHTTYDKRIRRHIILAPTQDQANLLFERVVEMLESALAVGRGPLAEGEGTVESGKLKVESGGAEVRKSVRVRRSPFPRLDFNGHRVIARSGHLGRSLRGNEATDIIVDEASYVPERLITEVAMPMLATSNGTLTLIGTPCGMNHFWRFFKMGEEAVESGKLKVESGGEEGANRTDRTYKTDRTEGADGTDGVDLGPGTLAERTPSPALPRAAGEGAPLSIWAMHAPSWASPYVSSDFLEAQRELISERAFRVEYGAEFLDSVGRVFRMEAIDACLTVEPPHPVRQSSPTSPTRGEVDLSWAVPPFFIGIDWARYSDYTAVVVLSGNRKGARLVCAERFHGMAWPELVEGVAAICQRYSECVANCDATGIGDAVEGMLRKRLPWLALKRKTFSNTFKAELTDGLAWLIENGRFKMRPHPELIRELQHFEALPSSSEGRWKFGAPEGFHDDLVIALGLACEILPPESEFKVLVGKPRDFGVCFSK